MKQPMIKRVPNPVDKHVGSRVRMRRMMLRMSQESLADGLGITFQQVQKYEKGTNRTGAGRLQHISHILEIPVAFFFDGSPHDHATRWLATPTVRHQLGKLDLASPSPQILQAATITF